MNLLNYSCYIFSYILVFMFLERYLKIRLRFKLVDFELDKLLFVLYICLCN